MTFGQKMRELIAERGTSLRKLSRDIPYDKGQLSKVSNDLKPPSQRLAELLDQHLGANGELIALVPPQRRPWTVAGNGLTRDDEDRLTHAIAAPRRLDAAGVEALAAVLTGQRRTEDVIGSAPLIEPVRAQLAMVQNLLIDARGPIRPRVVDVSAQWSQFAAWLHANSGRLIDANQFYSLALELAAEIDEPHMTATALNMKGHAAWLAGNVGPMIGLSQAAQRDHRASPGIRSLAAQQEARGHAMLSDAVSTDRKLDDAHDLATAIRADEEPPWVYFFNPDFLSMQRARAYLYLPDRQAIAAELLTAGLNRLSPALRNSEWAASYLVDLGDAFRALHEDEEAVKVAAEVESLVKELGTPAPWLTRRSAKLRAKVKGNE